VPTDARSIATQMIVRILFPHTIPAHIGADFASTVKRRRRRLSQCRVDARPIAVAEVDWLRGTNERGFHAQQRQFKDVHRRHQP
jgi:hypothetical protein